MRKPNIDFYYYKPDELEMESLGKLYFVFDWGLFEDYWKQLYRFGEPIETKKRYHEAFKWRNENRHRGFYFSFNIMGLRFRLEVPYKKVGFFVWGRDMTKSAHWPGNEPKWVLKRRRHKELEKRRAKNETRNDD